MSKNDEMVFLNGRIIPAAEARVSVFDAGFSHAAGLFETMRVYNGRAMHLSDHLDRLTRSASELEILAPVSHDILERGIAEVLAANELLEARLRLTMTPGVVPRPGAPAVEHQEPTVLITATPVEPYPAELYESGMRVCVCRYRQHKDNPLAGHKTLAYLPRLLAMKDAAQRKCHESLWFNTEHQLAEGSVCNVFTVQDGVIVTPPIETPVLPGIVRKAVLELAAANNMPAEERHTNINALLASTEVFLTGSVMEIMPVTFIEKHQVGQGMPGEVTRRMRELYAGLVRE